MRTIAYIYIETSDFDGTGDIDLQNCEIIYVHNYGNKYEIRDTALTFSLLM